MSVTLDIPDDVMAAIPVSEPQRRIYLLRELACALYAREVLSLGRAAELARMSKFDFGREIGSRGIARHYTETELEADLAYARGE
jgi:predicted HTH domain antitoxin